MEAYVVKTGNLYVELDITNLENEVTKVKLTPYIKLAHIYINLDEAKSIANEIDGKIYKIELTMSLY